MKKIEYILMIPVTAILIWLSLFIPPKSHSFLKGNNVGDDKAGLSSSEKASNKVPFKKTIEVKDNTINIDVKNVRLFDVLEDIGKMAGIKITIDKNVINKMITAKYRGKEIETALKSILGHNYALVFSKDFSAKDKYRLEEIRVAEMSLLKAIDNKSKTNENIVTSNFLTQIHSLVDKSMAEIDGFYKGHQGIKDALGNIVYYAFLYAIREDSKNQNMEQIYKAIRNAGLKIKNGQQLFAEAVSDSNDKKLKAAAKLLVQGDRELTREKDFAAVSISAKTDRPPLLSFQYGLPDWITLRNTAIELAKNKSGEECVLKEIRQKGIIDVIFKIETKSGQTLYVDPKQDSVFTKIRSIKRRNKENSHGAAYEEERNHRIRAQWVEFLVEGFNPKIFTLNDLTDLSKKRNGK